MGRVRINLNEMSEMNKDWKETIGRMLIVLVVGNLEMMLNYIIINLGMAFNYIIWSEAQWLIIIMIITQIIVNILIIITGIGKYFKRIREVSELAKETKKKGQGKKLFIWMER